VTQLEVRLSQELHDIAQRVAPADLRPLREPPAPGRPGRARWLAPVAAMAAVGAVAAALALARGEGPAQIVGKTWHPLASDPPLIAVAGGPRWGSASAIRMISARTGRVVRVLIPVPAQARIAQAPDGAAVYVAGWAHGRNGIVRFSTVTGTSSFVVRGAFPAVSPDGRYLAYTPGGGVGTLAVRDLRTGATKTIDLSGLEGPAVHWMTLGAVTWLGDGTQVLVEPEPSAELVLGSPPAGVWPRRPMCGVQDSPRGMCLIVVHVGPHALSAHRIYLPRRLYYLSTVISGDLSQRSSFFVARTGLTSASMVYEVTLRGQGAVWHLAARLPPRAMPEAIAPLGDRILYYPERARPPALWVATLQDGALSAAHPVLIDDSTFGFATTSW
jgi:hypothetical protein